MLLKESCDFSDIRNPNRFHMPDLIRDLSRQRTHRKSGSNRFLPAACRCHNEHDTHSRIFQYYPFFSKEMAFSFRALRSAINDSAAQIIKNTDIPSKNNYLFILSSFSQTGTSRQGTARHTVQPFPDHSDPDGDCCKIRQYGTRSG